MRLIFLLTMLVFKQVLATSKPFNPSDTVRFWETPQPTKISDLIVTHSVYLKAHEVVAEMLNKKRLPEDAYGGSQRCLDWSIPNLSFGLKLLREPKTLFRVHTQLQQDLQLIEKTLNGTTDRFTMTAPVDGLVRSIIEVDL